MANIEISFEYKKLIEEVNELKEKVSNILEEKDFLLYHTCEKIKHEYMSKIGVLEYKVYEFQCKYLRLKRKVELYQIRINRQEKINEKEIEEQLDKELAEYEEKMNEMKKDIENALNHLNDTVLSEEDSAEVKRIYRKLIKKLHPDLNKNISNDDKKLFLQLVQAYKTGNLKLMKTLELLCENISEKQEIELGEIDELKQRKEQYLKIIEDVTMQMDKIRSSFPYNQKDFINDEKQIEQRKIELNNELETYKKFYNELEERLRKLKENR